MGGFISPASLEQVLAASDIVDVIGSYIPLKRNGASFVALCPFHREKTPSFHVTPSKQMFYCFGCHKGGNVFTFVKEYENIDFPDAVRRLADRAHIALESENVPGGAERRHIKDQLFQVHEQITQRWQAALASGDHGKVARDYLAKRGVSQEAVQLFRIGCAPDLWDDTVNWAKSKHYDLPLIEQAGLIVHKEGAEHYYDRFRGRLIFPICDEQGRVVGFSGRILAADAGPAKYVNSPETPIFTKGKLMFGLDKSKRALLDTHCAVICEGQLDLIACFMAGVQNIVAPQGTALTADHTRILKRYVEEVVLCFDSDNAGQKAAVRSLDSLLASGLAIRVAQVPAPNDPDSFIKQFGGPAFADLIKNARGFFDYYLDHLCSLNDPATDRGKRAVVQAMSEALQKTGNDVLIDTHAQKTALRLGVAAEAARREFKKARPTAAPVVERDSAEPAVESEPAARPTQHELWLLRALMESDDQVEWVARHLDLAWLPTPDAREIISRRLQAGHDWPGAAAWVSHPENARWQSLVSEILTDTRPIPDPVAMVQGTPRHDGAVKHLRDLDIDRRMAEVNRQLAAEQVSEEDQNRLLLESARLRQLKKQPLAALGDQ